MSLSKREDSVGGDMKSKLLSLAALAPLVMLLSAPAFATNILSDGMFSEGATAGNFQTYATGSTIGPWNVGGDGVASSSVDLIGTYWPAPPGGGYSVDLNGTLGNNGSSSTDSLGRIFQDFNVATSGIYSVTFYESGNQDGVPVDKSYALNVNGDIELLNTKNSAQLGQWTKVYDSVYLPSGSDYIGFISTTGNQTNQFGAVIGNVSISAVPEASTWAMMLLGFAGLGFVGYRRASQKGGMSFTAA